jgi:hypothetical protein
VPEIPAIAWAWVRPMNPLPATAIRTAIATARR